jgi:hypothetical protein
VKTLANLESRESAKKKKKKERKKVKHKVPYPDLDVDDS